MTGWTRGELNESTLRRHS